MLNIHRRKELVAIDTIYYYVPAVASGVTQAQIYCGQESLGFDVFGMKIDRYCVNTLEDTIIQHGTIDKLLSDSTQVKIIGRVKYILRAYIIGNWNSEFCQQQ